MTITRSRPLLYWTPRALGLAVAGFLGLFALDAIGQGAGFAGTIGAFTRHLIPAFIVLAVVAIAWRWDIAGGLLFILAGFGYVLLIDAVRHPDWIVVIAGPLWLVGALFLVSGARHAGAPAHS